jgi:hypothetical protein
VSHRPKRPARTFAPLASLSLSLSALSPPSGSVAHFPDALCHSNSHCPPLNGLILLISLSNILAHLLRTAHAASKLKNDLDRNQPLSQVFGPFFQPFILIKDPPTNTKLLISLPIRHILGIIPVNALLSPYETIANNSGPATTKIVLFRPSCPL